MTKSASAPARFHSVRSVAEHFEVAARTVARWIERGELRAHHLGRQVRIAEEDEISFAAARRQ